MRILFLTPWYPDEAQPNHGIFIRDQAEALAEAGHEIVVISAKIDRNHFGFLNARETKDLEGGLTVIRLHISRSFPLYNQLNFFLICLRKTLRIVREFQPDILHGNIGYPGAVWTALVKSKTGLPTVLTEHTLLNNNFRTFIHRFLTLWAINKMDCLITVSRHSAEIMNRYTLRDIVVIPNAVNFSKFKQIAPFPPSPPISIGFLGGSFFLKKGLDLLIRALSQQSFDFILHIGGHDPAHDPAIRRLAEENGIADSCIFYGAIRRDEIPDFMRKLHFYVSASHFESFGITITEAMASGLPVICSESGGPADFTGSWSGITVPVGDVAALAKALRRMSTEFDSYDREKIRTSVISRFRSEQVARSIEAEYIKLMVKGSPGK